ncbi:regulatory protein VanR [Clostridium botulinum C str. Eklund]|nr:regulatory protein VanR [Clostridium botulinum C str. Eklund]
MILLDLIIPGICGEELIVKIRKVTKSPIIVISAKSDRKTKLELLENGADDFIIKPFDPDEVVARVNVNIRRYLEFSSKLEENKKQKLKFKDIILDKDTMEVSVNHKKVLLRKREFEILQLLLSNPKKYLAKLIYLKRYGKMNILMMTIL